MGLDLELGWLVVSGIGPRMGGGRPTGFGGF